MGATCWSWIRSRRSNPLLVPLAPKHRQPRIAREPLGLGSGTQAQRERGAPRVAHLLLVAAGVAQPSRRAAHSIHIPDATRTWTRRARSSAPTPSRRASV